MKEDYLWDKTGEDAEIQGLENALKAFRYTAAAPPELPAQVFTVEKAKPRRFFQFGFAFAAFASVFVILSVVWFQSANNKIPAAASVAEIKVPKLIEKPADEVIQTPEIAPVIKVENRKSADRSNIVKVRQNFTPVIKSNKAILRNTKVKEPIETLTAEEKYAYDQLMLALSVTSSSLKIVKDKVEGIEDKTAVLETAK